MVAPISKMKDRIDIEVETLTPDGGGGYTKNWGKLATVWGKVENLSGRDAYFSMQRGFNSTHKITIRYRVDVNTKQRIKHETKYYAIDEIINKDNKILELTCTEKNPDTF